MKFFDYFKTLIKRKVDFIIILISILSIVSFFIISYYSRALIDDFSYSILTHQVVDKANWNIFELLYAAIQTSINNYMNWQGLFFSSILASLQPGIFGNNLYGLGAIFIMLLIFLLIYISIRKIFKILHCNGCVFVISMVIFSYLLNNMPDITQGVYWFCSTYIYTPFFFLTLLNCILTIENIFLDANNNKRIILTSLFSVMISAGNYIMGVLNIGLLLLINFYNYLFIKKKRTYVPLIFALISFVIVFISPGTVVRASTYVRPEIMDIIVNCTLKLFELIYKWINIKYFCLIFLMIIFFNPIIERKTFVKINPFIYLIISFVIMFVLLCVPYISMGKFGQGRIENILWFTFIFLSIFNIIYIIIWLNNKSLLKINIVMSVSLATVLIVCSFVMNFVYTNGNSIIRELLNDNAKEFSLSYDRRIELIEYSRDEIIEVDELPESIIKVGDISTDINNWSNHDMGCYFNKKIAIKKKSSEQR